VENWDWVPLSTPGGGGTGEDDEGETVHGRVCLGTESSFRGPGPITAGIFLCRNLTVAATNITPSSLILSPNHFSRLFYGFFTEILFNRRIYLRQNFIFLFKYKVPFNF
jgi:hypothetical protein